MTDVVSLGETMVLMNPVEQGPLKYVHSFRKKIGGAESNFAIGLSRLGHDAAWFSRLGKDPHGRFVESVIAGEGVDTRHVQFTDDAPTGLMFKERRSATNRRVHYYRHGSAASCMEPDHLPTSFIAEADHFHVTGITPALSASCKRTTLHAFELAREHGTRTSFDPNIRSALWDGEATRNTLLEGMQRADVVVISQDEAEPLLDLNDPDEIVREVIQMPTELVAVTLDDHGALISDGEQKIHHPGFDVDVVDTVGAGDAFCAGLISGVLESASLEDLVTRANLCGALATTVPGDFEGLPYRDDLEEIRSSNTIPKKTS